MSTGRKWLKEFYVGFLLLLLTFLYLSHLSRSSGFDPLENSLTQAPANGTVTVVAKAEVERHG